MPTQWDWACSGLVGRHTTSCPVNKSPIIACAQIVTKLLTFLVATMSIFLVFYQMIQGCSYQWHLLSTFLYLDKRCSWMTLSDNQCKNQWPTWTPFPSSICAVTFVFLQTVNALLEHRLHFMQSLSVHRISTNFLPSNFESVTCSYRLHLPQAFYSKIWPFI